MLFDTTEAPAETTPDIMPEVRRWLAGCQAIVDADDNPIVRGRTLEIDAGGIRYLRIFYRAAESQFVFAFIDMTNGDVMKPDGWKRPAKKARGNLFDATGGWAE